MTRRISCVLAGVFVSIVLAAPGLGGDWVTFGGRADRNMVSDETGLPDRFDAGVARPGPASQPVRPSPKLNLKWTAQLGSQTWSEHEHRLIQTFLHDYDKRKHREKYKDLP
jgi:hypothetical protein